MSLAGPRLTVAVLTLDGAGRLPALLDAVGTFADEVVVGVDAASRDDSEAVALAGADRVFRFGHGGELARARMRVFDHATGDWIFAIDDDELPEAGFGPVVRELLSTPFATHAWFPRKWVAALDPPAFLYAPRWYPDWQLRLFRNDRSLVQKPPRPHSGYHVSGPGLHEPRAAILHYEPVWTDAGARRAKLDRYRAGGARGDWESQYRNADAVPRRPCAGPAAGGSGAPRRGPGVLAPEPPDDPPDAGGDWRLEILGADVAPVVGPGAEVVAAVRARNAGRLAWWPTLGMRAPVLRFTHHLLAGSGEVLAWDCERTGVPGPVPPGAEATFLHAFRAPEEAGDYLLEWDMVSEGERWFEGAGAPGAGRTALRVFAGDPHYHRDA